MSDKIHIEQNQILERIAKALEQSNKIRRAALTPEQDRKLQAEDIKTLSRGGSTPDPRRP